MSVFVLAFSSDRSSSTFTRRKISTRIGARKPVLALVPEGDARDILERAGTALVCPPRDLDAIKQALMKLIETGWHGRPDEAYIQNFERRRLTGQLAAIFGALTGTADQMESDATHPILSRLTRPETRTFQ